jgi:C-terminal, D2-small domain, of ClpB protein
MRAGPCCSRSRCPATSEAAACRRPYAVALGSARRAWAVEWKASALEFLLERGFSPEMGARPLKRAIEQYVIAPLAATIVERRFPEEPPA